jgi:cob(I)alamin adenosyltransferase
MTKFYTGTGDDGLTGILSKERVPKYHPIPETVGTIDEATAALGLARAACESKQTANIIIKVQRDLYLLMAEVSASPEHAGKFRQIDADKVNWLENKTDQLTSLVEFPKEFIVPGDTQAGASLAFARTIVRRAERLVVRLQHDGLLENDEILRYLNRLSSLCFILELYENQEAGKKNPTLAKDTDASAKG